MLDNIMLKTFTAYIITKFQDNIRYFEYIYLF